VPAWIRQACDVFNPEIKSLDDVVGKNRTLQEKREFVDYWFLRGSGDELIRPVTSKNEWAFKRDVENKGRGDKGSIQKRKESFLRSGLLPTRGGPFLYEHGDSMRTEEYLVGHWATFLEGCECVFRENPDHVHMVKMRKEGIAHSRVYLRRTPAYARSFIAELGNAEADVLTLTTPIEMWQCTDRTVASFEAHKEQNKITVKSMGTQSLYEDEHFKIANAVYPGRWGTSKNYYTRCAAFRRESQKIEVTSGPYKGDSLWRAIEKAFMEFGDFTNMDPKLVKNVVLSADALVKVLKDAPRGPETIVDILLLMIPTEDVLGRSPLLPNGVGLLDMTLTDQHVRELLKTMENTAVFEKLKEGSKLTRQKQTALLNKQAKADMTEKKKKERQQAKAAADAARAKPTSRAKGKLDIKKAFKDKIAQKMQDAKRGASGASSSAVATPIEDEITTKRKGDDGDVDQLKITDKDKTRLEFIYETEAYLTWLDQRQAFKARSLKLATLKACFTGSCAVMVNGLPRVIKGWFALRLLFRNHACRSAKLQPRPSEEAWNASLCADLHKEIQDGFLEQDVAEAPANRAATVDEIVGLMRASETTEIVAAMKTFFKSHNTSMPISTQCIPARLANEALMKLMEFSNSSADVEEPEKGKQIAVLAATSVADSVVAEVPVEWDDVMKILDSAKQHGLIEKLPRDVTDSIAEIVDMNTNFLRAIRSQIFFHILKSIGAMTYVSVSPPATQKAAKSVRFPYLPMHCQRVVHELFDSYNIASVGKDTLAEKPAFLSQLVTGMSPEGDVIGLSFVEAAGKWMSELVDVDMFICANGGQHFLEKKTTFLEKIKKASAESMKRQLASEGIKIKTTITRQIELFQSNRDAVVEEIVAAYDQLHQTEAEAALLYAKTSEIAIQRLSEKHGGSPPVRAPETAESKKDGDAVAVIEVKNPVLIPIGNWWRALLMQEGAEQHVILKGIVASAQTKISEVMMHHVAAYGTNQEVNGLCVKHADPREASTPNKKIKLEVHRVELANKSDRKDVNLPFWGKVVCEGEAVAINKAMCLPIGDNNGAGPKLYIEGLANNLRRSDGCLAWAIAPLPVKKGGAKEADEGSAKKKAATATAKTEAAVATHIIDYMDLQWTMADQTYTYTLPYLKDNPDHAEFFGKCHRATSPWDLGEVVKRECSSKEL
ncbi:unnamed protein product, partial [Prorocentrum cordatum]